MKQRTQHAEEELEVNMTPMLDIVFIMLIFFIVTAVFVKESGASVLRPLAKTATEVQRVSVLIAITGDNTIWLNKRQVSEQEISVIVEKMRKENPKGKVVIQADRQSHSGIVVSIVEQLNQIGVDGVSIATEKGAA